MWLEPDPGWVGGCRLRAGWLGWKGHLPGEWGGSPPTPGRGVFVSRWCGASTQSARRNGGSSGVQTAGQRPGRLAPTGCHGGRSLGVERQLRLEKLPESRHKESIIGRLRLGDSP